MVGSLLRSRKFLSPESILYLYKSQIRPKMEYCCHTSNIPPLVQRRDVATLSHFYRYHNGKCSNEFHSLVPPKKEFGRETRLAKKSHEHTLSIPKIRNKYHEQSFIPRTTMQWNALQSECFPEKYDLGILK